MSAHCRIDFGQHLPPISKMIKNILERYPDGQIFKVILFQITVYLKCSQC